MNIPLNLRSALRGRKLFLFPGLSLVFLCAGGLLACNSPESRPLDAGDGIEDNFHEKSFSWNASRHEGTLAKIAARETRFETPEALLGAITALEDSLTRPKYGDSLWKPIDYACNELSLALWNTYGTVRLRDSVVLDESLLKASCDYIGEDVAGAQDEALGKAAAYPTAVETDRRHPYKMIGESWDDFNIGVYKSTGGETQFKKHRQKFGFTGWYDTDATRIGVRIYLFNCSVTSPKVCYFASSHKDWYSNDDYVSKRDAGVGFIVKMTRPTPENNWTASPTGVGLMDFRVSDAVISMHSADHAGMQFRAMSSSGLPSNATIAAGPFSYDYVTW